MVVEVFLDGFCFSFYNFFLVFLGVNKLRSYFNGMENGKCGISILKEGKNKVENYRLFLFYNM